MTQRGGPTAAQLPSRISFLAIAAGLVAWAAVVRLPFGLAPRADADAALFWLIGHAWREGGLPYVALWDVKPPGIFLIFAGADALYGTDPFGGRVLAAIAVGIGAAGLYGIGERLLADRRAGLIAALLFPVYSLRMDGLASKPELFAAPFVIWGISIAARNGRGPAPLLLAGALMGAATMVKQTAIFEAAFAFFLVLATRRSVRACATLVGGMLIAPACFALYFVIQGAFRAFFEATVVGALFRLHGDGIPASAAPVQLLASLKPALPMLFLAGVGWVERRRIRWSGLGKSPIMVWGWLAAAALGELAMRATYPSYALPLLAPLCLASALPLAAMLRAETVRWRWIAGTLFALALAAPVVGTLASPDPDVDTQPPRVATYLGTHLPGRPIYVVDYDPVVYQLSGAPVPTRFPFHQHLMCDFPALPVAPEDELRRIVASRPAALVFTSPHRRMVCELPARIGLVRRLAEQAGYREVAAIGGPGGPVTIWTLPAWWRRPAT